MPNSYTKLSASIIFALLSTHAAALQITLANGEWPPILGQKLPGHGYGSQIVSRAFAHQGITVNYAFMPWRRALEATKQGQYHGTLLWSSNPERQRDFLLSQPVYRSQTVLFYHRQQARSWRQTDSLRNARVGVSNGYNYGARWRSLQEQGFFTVDQANSDAQNLAKLYIQRIDAFPCEAIVCRHLIATTLPARARTELRHDPLPVHSENMHLMLSRKTAQSDWLLQQFNQGLQRMRQSGELARLLGVAQLQR
ncbi:ABC transporter substrate-binding protein [Chitinibacter sp. GC72]|uniref:substrate-binding periplasmic protein n=1 Tax=Chitinibacter sp. GC72 TaxID=1526917 RepID=UPI0012F75F40|nr:transporter substrate-binding domain-containing protein [Chitinibacter sp. GC72]